MKNNLKLRNGSSGRCGRRSGNDFFLQPLGRVGEDRDLRLEQIRICISTGNIEKLSYCSFSRVIWSSNNKNYRLAFGWSHSLSQSYSFYSCLFYIMPLSLIIITL